jgi:Cu/Ag efflux protein CusF
MMKPLIRSAVVAFYLAYSALAMAQVDHSSMHTQAVVKPVALAADARLADALVKKVDKTKATLTLAHGALPNGMPAMTMAYKVKDPAWLNTLKVGQKIRFATDPADGGMTVTQLELVK